MRIAVTGATGNVGTSLVRALAADGAVTAIVGIARRRPALEVEKTEWLTADVERDELTAAFRGADAVVHLAWRIQPSRDLNALWRTNVHGSRRTFRAAPRPASGRSSTHPRSACTRQGRRTGWWTRLGRGTACRRASTRVTRLRWSAGSTPSSVSIPGCESCGFGPPSSSSGKRQPACAACSPARSFPLPLLRAVFAQVVPDISRLRFQAVHRDDVADAYRPRSRWTSAGPSTSPPRPSSTTPRPDSRELAFSASRPAWPGPRRWLLAPASAAVPPGWFDMAVGVPLMDCSRAPTSSAGRRSEARTKPWSSCCEACGKGPAPARRRSRRRAAGRCDRARSRAASAQGRLVKAVVWHGKEDVRVDDGGRSRPSGAHRRRRPCDVDGDLRLRPPPLREARPCHARGRHPRARGDGHRRGGRERGSPDRAGRSRRSAVQHLLRRLLLLRPAAVLAVRAHTRRRRARASGLAPAPWKGRKPVRLHASLRRRSRAARQSCFGFPGPLRADQSSATRPARSSSSSGDVLPTAWQAVVYADVRPGARVGVWGLGPIGQMCGPDRETPRRRQSHRHRPRARTSCDGSPARRRDDRFRGIVASCGHRARADRRPRGGLGDRRRRHGGDRLTLDSVLERRRSSPTRLTCFANASARVRRGGTVSLAGVYGGPVHMFPLGDLFDMQVTLRTGQANVRRWTDDILPLLLTTTTHSGSTISPPTSSPSTTRPRPTSSSSRSWTDASRSCSNRRQTLGQHSLPQAELLTEAGNSKPK